MAKLKLFSTIFSKLSSLIKKDGQVIISKDSQSLYIDIDGERVEITDWIDINTEEELLATLSPLANKFYYTKDTHKIWRYINSKWEKLNTIVTWETIKGKPSNIVYADDSGEVTNIETPIELTRNDIVDNLESDATDKVLSARQGKVLNDKINALNGKILILGDSLNLSGGWGDNVLSTLGCEGLVVGNGSAGFCSGGITEPYVGKNFIQVIEQVAQNMSEDERNSYTQVLLGGGINDVLNSYTSEQITTNVETFVTTTKELFANAEITIIPIHTFKRLTSTQLAKYQNIIQTALAKGCRSTSEFIWWCITNTSYDSGDNVHMNTAGYTKLSNLIAGFLRGATQTNITYATITGGTDATVLGGIVRIEGNKVHLQTNIKFTNYVKYKQIATINANVSPDTNADVMIPCMFYGKDTTGAYIETTGYVYVRDNVITIFNAGIPENVTAQNLTVYINSEWETGIDV